jgi:hypothetical protein
MQYDILPGRNTDNAKRALKIAEDRGFDPGMVRTSRQGYLIPIEDGQTPAEEAAESVVLEDAGQPEDQGESAPDIDGLKVAELDKIIEDEGLDVDTSLKKEDKVAAIKAARESKE